MATVTQVATYAFHVEGDAVNWVLVREGGDLTLVDSGYPGDALASGHAVSRVPGPQLLPRMFQHGDDEAALAALEELDAGGFLPGHGPPWTGDLAAAAALARERAAQRTW
jgi:glyoxylase-like metal-dependent hydrolase (beta-lactamase superfamily II)